MKIKYSGIVAASMVVASVFSGVVLAQSFPDVSESHVNYDAIEYVKAEGIVDGYPDGTFGADLNINRAEFMKIVVEAVVGQEPLEHAGSCFSDVESGSWYYPYICYGERMEWVGGYPDGSFKPGQNISFVEAAKIVSNAYDYEAKEGEEVWYKEYVQELGVRSAIPMSIEAFSQKITRGEMAEMIYRLKSEVTDKESQTYARLAGELPEGDFAGDENGEWNGELYVRGYVSTEMREEAFCEEDCEEFEYVMFNITENSNENAGKDDLSNFMKDFEGNAFVGENALGLGCVSEGQIYYDFATDVDGEVDFVKYTFSKEDSAEIMNSDEENQVVLKMERTPGIEADATTCTSLFSRFEVQ